MTVPDRDTGALIGLTIAFLGVFLGRVFDNEYLYGVASLLIGLTLGLMAVFLAYETKDLLIGEGLDRETLAQLRAIITRDKAVQHIERLLTHFFGPDDVLLTVEVRFREELSSREIRIAVARKRASTAGSSQMERYS